MTIVSVQLLGLIILNIKYMERGKRKEEAYFFLKPFAPEMVFSFPFQIPLMKTSHMVTPRHVSRLILASCFQGCNTVEKNDFKIDFFLIEGKLILLAIWKSPVHLTKSNLTIFSKKC